MDKTQINGNCQLGCYTVHINANQSKAQVGNGVMFADDLVLISQSKQGLQNALNKLQRYCDKWCLKINVDKTKVMIFNKQGRTLKAL